MIEIGTEVVHKLKIIPAQTIVEEHVYHRFIHTVLEQAKKEKLIATNLADDVTLPKKEKSKVDTYQTDELIKIREE